MKSRILAAAALLLLGVPEGAEADSTRVKRTRIERFLVSVPGDGVYLYDLRGQVLWSHRCDPYDACESRRGRILISDRRAGSVYEINREGQVEWERRGLQGPVNAEPVGNGNVLIVENDSGRVLEVGPGGDIVSEINGHQTPFDARRRSNGNTVVADSGNSRIVEYDPRGRKVRETLGLKFPNCICLLPDGRTLFTTYTNGTVGEIDASGKLAWELQIGGTLYSVEPEGETFWVGDGVAGRVMQISREGKILRTIPLGKSFLDVSWCR